MRSDRRDRLLAHALELAGRGEHRVEPNPMVGAVITKDGRVIAEGYHARYGGPHAEAAALLVAGPDAAGSTLYCNLEPCSFEGPGKHQPPCTRAIIGAGISRVVIGQLDPNPRVRGSGAERLREAGVDVEVVDDPDCWRLNLAFNTRMALERPFVQLKSAVSLDGRIASAGGSSKWISDETARREVHGLRGQADAVAVGIGTVLADDPQLTARPDGHGGAPAGPGTIVRAQPRPVVFDSGLRIPLDSFLVSCRGAELIVFCARDQGNGGWAERRAALENRNVTIVELDGRPSREAPRGKASKLSVDGALRALHRLDVGSLLVEGGSELTTSFLTAELYDRIILYIAPILLGEGVPVTRNLGVRSPDHAVRFEDVKWRAVGQQQVFEATRAGWLDDVRSVLSRGARPTAAVRTEEAL